MAQQKQGTRDDSFMRDIVSLTHVEVEFDVTHDSGQIQQETTSLTVGQDISSTENRTRKKT